MGLLLLFEQGELPLYANLSCDGEISLGGGGELELIPLHVDIEADGTVTLGGDAALDVTWYRELYSEGRIALGGDAVLDVFGTTVELGSDGVLTLGGRAQLVLGAGLPATDWEWGTPEVDPEVLQTLRVRLATLDGEYTVIDPAELDDLDIDLDRKGGVKSISLTLRRDSRHELGDLDYGTRCEIDYLGRTFSAWLAEASLDHGSSSMTRTVTMYGEIARLSQEHEAFRRVYVDSRLSAWKTDQGPQTQSNVWEVQAGSYD